jgi:transcriptional regulator with XRE-family HTH domain
MDTVKQRREQLGFTQKDVAIACGVSPSFISHVERGQELPSVTLLSCIADKLKISPTKLLELLNVRSAKVTDLQKERERRTSR